jgi:hypothetical protein
VTIYNQPIKGSELSEDLIEILVDLVILVWLEETHMVASSSVIIACEKLCMLNVALK